MIERLRRASERVAYAAQFHRCFAPATQPGAGSTRWARCSTSCARPLRARALARRCLRVMRQNLVWAAAYNAACVPLALIGWLPPWAAGLGMATSSLVVVLNSLRLAR